MVNEKRVISYEEIRTLFNEEYKKTVQLIHEGETHLDNLAEGFTEADRVIFKLFHGDDMAAVAHGRWLINPDGYYPYCSECKEEPKGGRMTNYCPNCGAKMDGDKNA